jgi:hypothetical protein
MGIMGIYRGAGGTGDATNDGYSEASIIRSLAADVEVARDEAVAAADAADASAVLAEAAADSIDPDNFVEVTDIGVTVQAYDADLTSWAGVATTAKQDTLVSGTNIKTVNSSSLLGSGNLTVGDVTLAGTETLTNKTISADNNTLSGIAASSFVLSNGSGNIDGSAVQKAIPSGVVVGTTDTQTLTNKTITNLIMDGYIREEVFAVSGTTPALSPSNGTIQTWSLSGNSTPTQGTWTQGESMTLMIDDGTARTITWTSVPVVWVGGTAPTLATTGFTVIELWEVGTTIYGALVGNVA